MTSVSIIFDNYNNISPVIVQILFIDNGIIYR